MVWRPLCILRLRISNHDLDRCRYAVLALCTGYHPVGYFGERIIISVGAAEPLKLTVPMIPVRIGVMLTVRELVPFNESVLEEWRKKLVSYHGSHGSLGVLEDDLRQATVLLHDPQSMENHKFLAIPVEQHDLVSLQRAGSGVSPTCVRN